MKKIFLLALIACTCLFTGCTKNYKTVDEYSTAMSQVRSKLGDYTIKTEIQTNEANMDCLSYKKGDRWKTEISRNGGKSYNDGILYDGDEVYSYSKSQKMAMSIPFKQMITKQGIQDENALDMVMKMINPVGILFYWDLDEIKGKNCELWKFGKITKKNKIPCRMLHNANGPEICISDKYGIAVYAKISTPEKGDLEYNVKSIDNTKIPENDMGLPDGVKKLSMADLFKSMAKMME